MIHATAITDWAGTAAWFVGLVAVAFLVTEVGTEVVRLRRAPYIGVLAAVTAAFTAGYLVWSGNGSAFWTDGWGWGILGGVVAGALLAVALRRIREPRVHQPGGVATVLWETVVYGAAEGVLLSVLPVVMIWSAFAGAGWSTGWLAVGAGAAAMVASLIVIVAHHLGYAAFRNKRMAEAVMGCAPLTLAYLVTGNPFSAIVGHILLHAAVLQRHVELPPERSIPAPAESRLRLVA